MNKKINTAEKEVFEISKNSTQITVDTGHRLKAFHSWQMGFVAKKIEKEFALNAEHILEKKFNKHIKDLGLIDDGECEK
jgi:ribosomal protein L9